MSLRYEQTTDLKEIECELGNPTFTWKGGTYNFIPSITEFKRDLEDGGFSIGKLLTATVRKFDLDDDGNFVPIFGDYPTAQEKISYSLDGTSYRIETVKHDPTNASFRLIAHSTSKGV